MEVLSRIAIDMFNYVNKKFSNKFELFKTKAGLRRTIDKIYVLVYALFSTIVRSLKAQVTIKLDS